MKQYTKEQLSEMNSYDLVNLAYKLQEEKSIKEIINARIRGALEDLANFHTSTYDFVEIDVNEESDIKAGEDIERQINDTEFTKQEDATYILGRLDAYRDTLRQLN
jgi:hypothetical protein